MISKLKEDLYNFRYAIIVFIIYGLIMQILFKSICPVKALFGIDCPGCGMTRATCYLLKGDIHNAINSNYSVFSWWFFVAIFLFDRYIHKFKIRIIPILFLIIYGAVALFRYFVFYIL